MRHLRPWLVLSSAVLLAAAFPLACGGKGNSATGSTQSGTGGSGSGTGGGGPGGGIIFSDGGMDPVVSISISPANVVIEVKDGVIPAATTFTATGKTQGGAMVPVTGSWSYDRPDAAAMNSGSGALTATGLVGGLGTVTLKAGGLTATTAATVKLHLTSDPETVDPSTKMMFGQASAADPAMTMLYPYDKTVFPRGLTGPVLQWNGGGASDIYYIHAVSPTFEYEAWGKVPPPSRYTFPSMPVDVWKKLTDSTSGDISVSVQRNDGSQPYTALTRTWTVAPANLTGTIYFWEVNNGSVKRIQPGSAAPAAFLQAPPGVSCIACHSVSKDGSTLVASFNGGQSPWGTFDAASGASILSSGENSGFQAISPDGKWVLWRQWIDGSFNTAGYLSLSKSGVPTDVLQLNPGTGAPAYPAWSGDGKKVALAVRTDGNGLDFNTSTLWTTDVDLSVPSFSNTHKIIDGIAGRSAVIYPTFSPDSKWIAFERSTQARSRGALGDVWLAQADGSNTVALDQANGAGLLTANEVSSTYEPTFMPVAAGGYIWLVVVSERQYGNTLTDTARNTRHKQLWVTAIDQNPMPGQDPSHPAFWLPGQEIGNNNMRGEWALSPCKMLGDTCTAGYDCCGGFCRDDGTGALKCTDQSGGCSQVGETCKVATDCCDPQATCQGGFCAGQQQH